LHWYDSLFFFFIDEEFGSEVFIFGLDYEGGNMRLLVIMIPHLEKAIIMKLMPFWRSFWRCKRLRLMLNYFYFIFLLAIPPSSVRCNLFCGTSLLRYPCTCMCYFF